MSQSSEGQKLDASPAAGNWVSELISLCLSLIWLLYKVLEAVISSPPYVFIVCLYLILHWQLMSHVNKINIWLVVSTAFRLILIKLI